jgi:hypothetical protein
MVADINLNVIAESVCMASLGCVNLQTPLIKHHPTLRASADAITSALAAMHRSTARRTLRRAKPIAGLQRSRSALGTKRSKSSVKPIMASWAVRHRGKKGNKYECEPAKKKATNQPRE